MSARPRARIPLAVSILLGLAACGSGGSDEPELLRIRSIAPDSLVAGSTVRILGEGFPIARDGELRLEGECTSPGQTARRVTRDLPIHAESAEVASLEVDDALVRGFGGRSTCSLAARVRFVGGHGAVVGRSPAVVLDVLPTGRDRVTELAGATEHGRAVARRIGVSFEDENPEGGGLRVKAVVPSSLAARAGIVASDVLVRLDGVRLHDLADFRPTPGIRRTELEVRREGRVDSEVVLLSALATDASSTAATYGYAAIGFLFLMVCAFLSPPARFVSFLARRSPRDAEETLAWLFGTRAPGTPRERRRALALVIVSAAGMAATFVGIAAVGRWFVRDLGVSILLSASLVLRMAARVFGETEESRREGYLPFFVASAPLTVVVAAIGLLVGTGHFGELHSSQSGTPDHWLVFANPIAFALFPVFAATALTRVEPEGTSSSLARVAARAHLLVVGALGAVLFLGGWSVPVASWPEVVGTAGFVAKAFALMALGLWARSVTDGAAHATWKWTVPTSVLGLAGSFVYSAAEVPAELERASGVVLLAATAIVLGYVVLRRVFGSDEPDAIVLPFL